MDEEQRKESAPPRRTTSQSQGQSQGQSQESAARNAIPELVRKALAAGFSGFFFTEEAIRKALGDTLPREWADFATEQSDRARAEFLERLSYEIGRALEGLDYAAVLAQLLEGRTLEVNAKIRLHDERPRRGRRPRLRVEVDRDGTPPEDEGDGSR